MKDYTPTKINDHFTFDLRITVGVLNEQDDLSAFFAELRRLGARVEETRLVGADRFKNGQRELLHQRETGLGLEE